MNFSNRFIIEWFLISLRLNYSQFSKLSSIVNL